MKRSTIVICWFAYLLFLTFGCKPAVQILKDVPQGTIKVPNQYIVIFTDKYVLEFEKMKKQDELYLSDSVQANLVMNKFFPSKKSDTSLNIVSVFTYGFSMYTPNDTIIKDLRSNRNIKSIYNNYLIPFDVGKFVPFSTPSGQVIPENIKYVMTTVRTNIASSTKRMFVLDSGIDPTHSDLNISPESKSFVPGEKVDDVLGHGTHVAGIIGAKNNASHTVGVAPNALIVAFKIFNSGSNIDFAGYLKALDVVKTVGKAGEVVNLSIDDGGYDPTEEALIKDIAGKGIFVVIAAGNKGKDIDVENFYPQKINAPNVYVVASHSLPGPPLYSKFSNYGSSVDYAAPGENIVSTAIRNSTATKTGTSQSAPHVAGLLYLLAKVNFMNTISDRHARADIKVAHE